MIRRMKRMLILLIVDAALSACASAASSSPTIQSGQGVIPTPASSLVGNFVWQTDGVFGYRMLRPANWESTKPFDGRYYGTPGFQDKTDRLMLRVVNLQAYDESGTSATGMIAQLALFEKDSSLDGWTKGIEQMWKSDGLEPTLLRRLPQAKIYSVKTPGYSNVQLVAYAVDKNQPLAIELTASGGYANMERLQREGILDDFAMMVASIQAVPQDPQNIDPPLSPVTLPTSVDPTASPTVQATSISSPTPTAISAVLPTASGDLSWLTPQPLANISWKNYKGKFEGKDFAFSYQFSYPADWFVYPQGIQSFAEFETPDQAPLGFTEGNAKIDVGFVVCISPEAIASEDCHPAGVPIVVAGLPAFAAAHSDDVVPGLEIRAVDILKDNVILRMGAFINGRPDRIKTYEQIFGYMVSTLKFGP